MVSRFLLGGVPKLKALWKGKAKTYPGIKKIIQMNKSKVIQKKKPKLRII